MRAARRPLHLLLLDKAATYHLVDRRLHERDADGSAIYNATKAYVLSLGAALAMELRNSGVTLTTLCPGPTFSGFYAAAGCRDEVSSDNPGWRMMKSADVARQGYLAMKQGHRTVVPGWGNKLHAFLLRYWLGPALL